MNDVPYLPVLEVTRGQTIESIHFGAAAVVDPSGKLVASYGDPQAVTFLRSTAKPFQALPFFERNGHQRYQLEPEEMALLCASHSGTDEHVRVVRQIQRKTGVEESDLMCGVHPLSHQPTIEAMRRRGEPLTPNRHNCSGKHTGMLASALMQGFPKQDYVDFGHPLQKEILGTFAEMCSLPEAQVRLGIDGCSAPNFAVPLYNAALAFARLRDPQAGGVLPAARAAACGTLAGAMTTHPAMVGGPASFDTHLMRAADGRILAKAGAEGYQGLALAPGALGPGSAALGITLKVSDGDADGRARPAFVLAVLSQLGALAPAELRELSKYGPQFPVKNWREIVVGEGRPVLNLVWN
jgi:L-asparaginase II